MRLLSIASIVLLQLHLSGCAGTGGAPMTAEDFRMASIGAADSEVETFEVDRSFDSVVSTFRRKAPECLDKTVRTAPRMSGGEAVVSKWTPTLIVGADKAELHIQRLYEQGVVRERGEPAKGQFMMLVDIVPASMKKTRIEIYRPTQGVHTLLRGVRSWATGKDIVCPDLSKN
jgi:hypothetical protein